MPPESPGALLGLSGPVGRGRDTAPPRNVAEVREQALDLLEAFSDVTATSAEVELALGRGLESLFTRFDLGELGHGHRDDACRERFGFSAAHARELRRLARELPERPGLLEAFRLGILSRKKVVETLRVATAEDEAGWALFARRLTTRELQRHVSDVLAGRRDAPEGVGIGGEGWAEVPGGFASDSGAHSGAGSGADADEPWVWTGWRGTAAQRVVFERFGLEMARTVTGVKGPTHVLVEAIAADVLAHLDEAPPDPRDGATIRALLAGRVRRARECHVAGRRHGTPLGAGGRAAEDFGGRSGRRPGEQWHRRATEAACRAARRTRRSPKRLARIAQRMQRRFEAFLVRPRLVEPCWSELGDAWEALAWLQRLVATRDALEWERTALLGEAFRRRLHRGLGLSSFTELAERTLGLAPRTWSQALDLSGRLAVLPEISRAWREGRIGGESVRRLARIAEPETELDWLSFAEVATVKLLELAVAWAAEQGARALARDGHAAAPVRPPRHLPVQALRADWIDLLASREQRARHRKRLAAAGVAVDTVDSVGPQPIDDPLLDAGILTGSLRGFLAGERVGFAAPESVAALFWAAVEAVRRAGTVAPEDSDGRSGRDGRDGQDAQAGRDGRDGQGAQYQRAPHLDDAEAVQVMLHVFARARLTPETEAHLRRHRVLLRDGHRCTAPGCRALADLNEHHVVFRSAGGGDEPENLTTLCRACHRLVHVGRLRVTGTAPAALRWDVGPRPDGGARETFAGERRVRASRELAA